MDQHHLQLIKLLARPKSKMLHGFVESWVSLTSESISAEYHRCLRTGRNVDSTRQAASATLRCRCSAVESVVRFALDGTTRRSEPEILSSLAIECNNLELCRFLIRFWPDCDWLNHDTLRQVLLNPEGVAILEALLRAKTSTWQTQRRHVPRDPGRASAELSFMPWLWHFMIQKYSPRLLPNLLVFMKYQDAGSSGYPCWAGLGQLDLAELLGSVSARSTAVGDEARNRPVVRIVMAARTGDPRQVRLLRACSSISERDLELALLGATISRCVDTVGILLQAGVDPDTPLVSGADTDEHRDSCEYLYCLVRKSPLLVQAESRYNTRHNPDISKLLLHHGATVTTDTVAAMRPIFANCSLEEITDTLRRRPEMLREYGPELLCMACHGPTAVTGQLLTLLHPDVVNSPLANWYTYWDKTPLQYCLRHSGMSSLEMLWKHGACFQPSAHGTPGNGGVEVVIALAQPALTLSHPMKKIRFLVEHGAELDCEVVWGGLRTSPLLAVLESTTLGVSNFLPILDMVLDGGADPSRIVGARSPLEVACGSGSIPIVTRLLQRGAKVQRSGLIRALMKSGEPTELDLDLLRLIIPEYKKAEVDMRDELSWALVLIAGEGLVETAVILLEAGASVRYCVPAQLRWGGMYRTATETAASRGHREMVELLLEAEGDDFAGVEPEAIDSEEPEAIDSEASDSEASDSGAERMTTKKRWSYALKTAREMGHLDVVELLERHMARFVPLDDPYGDIDLQVLS